MWTPAEATALTHVLKRLHSHAGVFQNVLPTFLVYQQRRCLHPSTRPTQGTKQRKTCSFVTVLLSAASLGSQDLSGFSRTSQHLSVLGVCGGRLRGRCSSSVMFITSLTSPEQLPSAPAAQASFCYRDIVLSSSASPVLAGLAWDANAELAVFSSNDGSDSGGLLSCHQ